MPVGAGADAPFPFGAAIGEIEIEAVLLSRELSLRAEPGALDGNPGVTRRTVEGPQRASKHLEHVGVVGIGACPDFDASSWRRLMLGCAVRCPCGNRSGGHDSTHQ